ncbi:hypothetical protein KBC70_00115 [Candidatus Woesebacteria bacterium]|nr:hypothetical protein [Candidatus Woesebacteria bacterium]
MTWKKLAYFVGIRFLIYSIIAAWIYLLIPYSGNFPYKDVIQNFKLPFWVYSWANFDGAHYIHIALQGYHQYDQAYFPGYILLVQFFGGMFGHYYLHAGILISNAAFIAAGWYFYRLFKELYGKKSAVLAITFLFLIPTSFFFSAVYTESLFLLLTVSALFYLLRKKFVVACILAGLSSFVRLQGVFLVIPFLAYAYLHMDKKSIWTYVLAISPCIGLSLYMTFLWKTTGDPLYFFNSQPIFGAQRSTELITIFQVYYRYIKIFVTAQPNFQYFIAVLEFLVVSVSLVAVAIHGWLAYRKQDIFNMSLALYSLTHIVVPSLTGTFSSTPRYALMVLSLYYVFSQIPSKNARYTLLGISLILHIFLFGFFVQGYFIS